MRGRGVSAVRELPGPCPVRVAGTPVPAPAAGRRLHVHRVQVQGHDASERSLPGRLH